ncbi:hypothetical protein [Polymorphum gilvum]|uniref:Uncharacterized protein n=1 Tax=Polymorphum gilvum (strain LMG 25793 / CGMCC 1.9160 / SL003B-26A1) TaxID=991905 RepID=F2IVJ9_POLGS|nr:hypothetical protein [Polymorphum gilvum]ADZ72717.1 hypothetical protein SL003B_4300 [Polymorphum gilvum SL003B-26A1]
MTKVSPKAVVGLLVAGLIATPAGADSVYRNDPAGAPYVEGAPAQQRHYDRRDVRPGYRPGERPGYRPGEFPGYRPGTAYPYGGRSPSVACPPDQGDCVRDNRR